jgi:hypothetical protein
LKNKFPSQKLCGLLLKIFVTLRSPRASLRLERLTKDKGKFPVLLGRAKQERTETLDGISACQGGNCCSKKIGATFRNYNQ